MPLQFHPEPGTIVICDFNGFVIPEMVKRRPCIIISPRFRNRDDLCTIVPLSTTKPTTIMPYHYRLHLTPPLPDPYNSPLMWVKGDMLTTVSFKRLALPFKRKNQNGKREYDARVIDMADFIKVKECILHGLGMTNLTQYL